MKKHINNIFAFIAKHSFYVHSFFINKYFITKYIISESNLKGRRCLRNKNELIKIVNKQHPRHFSYINEMIMTKDLMKCNHIPDFIKFEENAHLSFFYYKFYNYITISDILKYKTHLKQNHYHFIKKSLYNILRDLKDMQVIHRDINPSNILVNRKYTEVIMIDYQWAIYSGQEIETTNINDASELTKRISVLNTKYRNPESTNLNFENDLYSVNKILMELKPLIK